MHRSRHAGQRLRRTLVAAALGTALLGGGACGTTDCTLIGSESIVRVAMPVGVPSKLTSVQITLCQGDRCEETAFPAKPVENKYDNGYIEKGVFFHARTYSVNLDDRFKGDWDADADTTLTVTGLSDSGQPVVKHDESFTFTKDYPNGEECDETPYLQHKAVVIDQDVAASPVEH